MNALNASSSLLIPQVSHALLDYRGEESRVPSSLFGFGTLLLKYPRLEGYLAPWAVARVPRKIITVAAALRKHPSRSAMVLSAIRMREIDESLIEMI
ncbi:hypothetical protein BDW67DRAFT_157681, partial [Aspergillus spinulosporus]